MTAETQERWRALAQHPSLGLLLDLDGTLVPFVPTPDETKIDDELRALLGDLAAAPGMTVAIVSGRTRSWLDAHLGDLERVLLVAEHGGHRRAQGAWHATLTLEARGVADLAERLERVARRARGALVEKKTWSVSFHVRAVPDDRKIELLVEADSILQGWLEAHPDFERLYGAEVVEIRPAGMRKSGSVAWFRQLSGPDARLCAIGDDLTDEDTFRALGPLDEAILVSPPGRRPTVAGSRLDGPPAVRAFLRWILAVRAGIEPTETVLPSPIVLTLASSHTPASHGLLVVSNRLPDVRTEVAPLEARPEDRKRNVGGLVSALAPALETRRGVWLGWSGRTIPDGEPLQTGFDDGGRPTLAWIDYSERWYEGHYNGTSNRALWPLFHSFPERVRVDAEEWNAYVEVQAAFADTAVRLISPDAPIWVHDYHLLLLARALRRRGHVGPIGLFLHIPFPGVDVLSIFPWADEILDAMIDFDLLGFHTPGYAANFLRSAGERLGAKAGDDAIEHRGRRARVRSIPIGIFPESWEEPAPPDVEAEVDQLGDRLQHRKLVLGVDRLDYTKGIPERLLAFGRLLERHPEWHDHVSFVQISVPSRADVAAYAEQRDRIENLVGRINGEHGEAHWVPVRYLYRSYGRSMLAELYRRADVGLVTPLRDGMNLVAKEYVAAQDPRRPGVLVLSSLAGAAVEMRDAVLTNPWFVDGMADDLDFALRMPLEERIRRHERLRACVEKTTAITWAEEFLRELTGSPAPLP